jgi:hypothetical protein
VYNSDINLVTLSWNWPLRDRECQQLESFLVEVERNLSISDLVDRRMWQLEKNVIFTVKSACALFDDILHPRFDNFGALLWKGIFTPKIEILMWLLLYGSLSTKGFLTHRRIISYDDACCSFCGMKTETIDHLFIYCSVTWRFWNRFM